MNNNKYILISYYCYLFIIYKLNITLRKRDSRRRRMDRVPPSGQMWNKTFNLQ